MPGADVKGTLKLNAKKIGDEARAFFFAADRGQDPVLYIDRKFDDPKRFGNAKKIIKVCQALFELELSTKAKICAGTVSRDEDGVLNFSPAIQKANAAALKKALKALKKEVGRARIVSTDEEESASPTEATATTAVDLNQVKAALRAFVQAEKAGDDNVSELADAGIDVIDRYATGAASDDRSEDDILAGESIRGKTLAEWRARLVDAQSDDDEFSITETLEELRAEQQKVTEELQQEKEKFIALKENVKKGEVAVTGQVFARLLVDLVKVGDVDPEAFKEKVQSKMSKSLTKLKEAVDGQDVQREETLDKVVELEVVAAKADLKRDLDRLKADDLSDDDRNKLKDDVAQGKMRLEHAEVKQQIRTLEKKVDELSGRVEVLTGEAKDTEAGQALMKTVPDGVDGRALSEALRKISEGLDAAMQQLEQAEDELEGCRDKERLLNSLRGLARAFTALQAKAAEVLSALSDPDLSDEDRGTQQEALLQIRIDVDQNLAELRELRAEIKAAPKTAAPRRANT